MKKIYNKPQVDVVEVKINNALLSVSTPDAGTAKVSVGGDFSGSESDID